LGSNGKRRGGLRSGLVGMYDRGTNKRFLENVIEETFLQMGGKKKGKKTCGIPAPYGAKRKPGFPPCSGGWGNWGLEKFWGFRGPTNYTIYGLLPRGEKRTGRFLVGRVVTCEARGGGEKKRMRLE